jgi:hypothetical protein
VGSSSIRTEGSTISSTPIEVRLRSPPEIVFLYVDPTRVFLIFQIPRSLHNFSTRFSCSSTGMLSLNFAANDKASRTVKYSKMTSSCMTYPPTLPYISCVKHEPLIFLEPVSFLLLSYLILSASAFSKDVFPAPEDPII